MLLRRSRVPVGSSWAVTVSPHLHGATLRDRIGRLVRAIEDDDEPTIEAILRVSRSRRVFAPLAFVVGALAMVLDGLRRLVLNWRLTLVVLLPAVWIELSMLDLKAHVLGRSSLPTMRGPYLIPIALAIVLVTAGCFFLNSVFAFAIARSPRPTIRPAFAAARRHMSPIIASGAVVGALLAVSMTVAVRWRPPWFALSLGIIVGVMMICYVAVPSRLIGVKATYSRRDKLTATVLLTVLGTVICTPPYLLGRLGVLMVGSRPLLIPGILVLALGFSLQAGTTGAVRAIRMSAALAAGEQSGHVEAEETDSGSGPLGS
jgi:hypothetical protein